MTATLPLMAPDCASDGCGRQAQTRGYCERHYRRRLHTGRYGYRDAGPARAHVLKLRGLGWPYIQMAQAAGTSTWVPHRLALGRVDKIMPESETAILALPLVPYASHRGVDGTGTYRRWEALQWMGWPAVEVARRVGVRPYSLGTMRSRGEQVSFLVARSMARVFEELEHIPGPSKQTATKARRRGCAPPAAWDEDTIDDPNALPQMDAEGQTVDEVAVRRVIDGHAKGETLTPAERADVARRMLIAGQPKKAIAQRLHCSYGSLMKLLEAS